MRLADQHKAFETVLPLLQPELNRLAQSFQMAPPPNSALLQTDPNAYLQQLAAHNDSQAELQRLQQIMGVNITSYGTWDKTSTPLTEILT